MTLTVTQSREARVSNYSIPEVGVFDMPTLEGPNATCLPAVMFHGAASRLGEIADQRRSVKSDPNLSELGREAKLEPLRKEAVLQVARVDAILDDEEAHWTKREESLLAVPQIDPGHSVAAIEAREIRDWFRALSPEERAKVMDQMDNEPGHEKTILALLRSPIPQLEMCVQMARSIWDRTRRLENVAEALAIDQGRANLEWARRGAAHLAGMTKNMVGWSDDKVARALLSDENQKLHNSAKVFGIDARTVEKTKSVLAYEAQQRK